VNALGSALYARLSGDATLTSLGSTGVYQGIAPQGAALPHITIQMADGFDRRVFGARATVVEEWIVKAWDSGASHKRARQLIERVDALLDEDEAGLGTVTGWRLLNLRRSGQLPDMSEIDQGVVYRSSGARYEIEVAP
jgi:hypothetical protein